MRMKSNLQLLTGPGNSRLKGVLPVAILTLFVLVSCSEKKEAAAPAPPDVEVVDVVQKDVPVFHEWVAQLNGDTNAAITPKVQGYVLTRNYREGFFVKQGDLLFTLDPRPFQATLDQAKGELAVAYANLSKTETDVARDTPLAAQSAIPQKQLDNDHAAESAAKAQVEAAKAMVQEAELNLAWTKVFSPIDGIAGTANSNVGDLVGTSTKMTTISKVNPIRAYFSLSENDYLQSAAKVAEVVAQGKVSKNPLSVEFIQANEVPYPEKGRIILINREVSTQTGTIQFAAEFSNPEGILRPGGIGRARIQTSLTKDALLVPQRSVIEVQSQYQVVVLGADNKVSFRPVKVGDRVGPDWVITEGLKPGEKIVAQGFMKVKDGMQVNPKPFVESAAAGGE
jgi:membrane fusion protein (multidrug efflux system)